MPRPDHLPCPHCQGTGKIELTGIYGETLVFLRKLKGEHNGAEIARMMGAPETAMNNRLVMLERYGFAVGRKYGRQRLWKATK